MKSKEFMEGYRQALDDLDLMIKNSIDVHNQELAELKKEVEMLEYSNFDERMKKLNSYLELIDGAKRAYHRLERKYEEYETKEL